MNKLLLSFAFCLTTITSFAQEAADRMMVHQKDGSVRSYAISNVDSVTFGKSDVQGDVTVTVLATMGSLAYGSATMPEGCRNGDIALIPNDGTVTDYSAYIRSHSTIKMTQATNTWSYSTLEPAGRYIVAAQAYDDMGAVVSMGYTELNPGTGDVVDLGEGANTYIVPAKGRYSFMPLHIDGSRISGISSVDWLWSTRTSNQNSAQGLVSDIQIEDNGRISFDATGEKGSVVFAAFDADNKVIWTWLIWCTDKPATMRYANGVEFMDRNMGAISANPEDGTDTWGLLWQWGRITPFFGGYAENEWEASDAFKESKAWTVVNTKYDYQWAYKLEGTSIEGAIAAPFTLFNDDLTCDWHVPADLTLWSSTIKTNYDPVLRAIVCPLHRSWLSFTTSIWLPTAVATPIHITAIRLGGPHLVVVASSTLAAILSERAPSSSGLLQPNTSTTSSWAIPTSPLPIASPPTTTRVTTTWWATAPSPTPSAAL